MRGLAFPVPAQYGREPSYETEQEAAQTTIPATADIIPIDPALQNGLIDLAMVSEQGPEDQMIIQNFQQQDYLEPAQTYRQYSQGPQGDPFAPPENFIPVEQPEPQPTPKPIKKKRKPRREPECGLCQGDNQKNKSGEPELMVSCAECGRSGHPTCLTLGKLSPVLHTYPWTCLECKVCEICKEKGDDERILFCDHCDRGWHMDCLNPTMEAAPEGDWHCQECPPVEQEQQNNVEEEEEEEMEPEQFNADRASSVASTSHSPSKAPRKGRGKARKTEEDEMDVEPDTTDTKKTSRKKKGKRRATYKPSSDEDDLELEPQTSPKRPRVRISSPANSNTPRVHLRLPPRRSRGKDRDEEDKGLFDDFLSATERDTSRTMVQSSDKQNFERSRLVAEAKLAPPSSSTARISEGPETPVAGPSSRPLRSAAIQQLFPASVSTVSAFSTTPSGLSGFSTSPAPSTPGPAFTQPQTLRIQTIRFGEFDIKTWYDAPFPEEYATIPDGRLWICEFCLKYMKSRFGAVRHRLKCKARHPPGDEIYRDGAVSIFEVDGRKNKIYCQNLCLLSKMFLDHKSLFYDVEPFLFYVITEVDDFGARFVGYFSKEKMSPKDYNVSCIMTLPVRQRKGWGNYLIDFSYLLSKKEQRLGSPEKPLSSLGALGYRNYWTLSLMRYLQTAPDKIRLEDICAATSMTLEDAHATLVQQNMITTREVTPPPARPSPGQSIKFPKGRKNGLARRALQRTQTQETEEPPKGPFVAPTQYEIHWDKAKVDEYLNTWETKGYLKLKPEKLKWSPFLLARTKKREVALATETSERATTAEITAPEEEAAPNIGLFDSSPLIADNAELPAFTPAKPTDDNAAQLEQDRLLACKLASPERRLRSRSSQASGSTPSQSERLREQSPRTPRVRKEASPADRSARQQPTESTQTDSVQNKRTDSFSSISPRKKRRMEQSPTQESHSIITEKPPLNGFPKSNGYTTNVVDSLTRELKFEELSTKGYPVELNGHNDKGLGLLASLAAGLQPAAVYAPVSVPSNGHYSTYPTVNGNSGEESGDLDAEGDPDCEMEV